MSRIVPLVVVGWAALLGLVVAEGTPPTTAQDATALASPRARVACAVEPRPTDELLALWFGVGGTPFAAPLPASPVASEAELPAGQPADAATVVALTATLQELDACFATNQFARGFALLTDDGVRRFSPPGQTLAQVRQLLEAPATATPTPAPGGISQLRDARVLGDGRVGAILLARGAELNGPTTFVYFERQGDRWLIDAFVGFGLTRGTPVATPVAGPAVVPPNMPAYGRTYGEWTGAWFRWYADYLGYTDHSTTTEACAAGQAAPVWFLPAIPVAPGAVTFACAVPGDRAILIPIQVAANASAEGCEATIDRPIEIGGGVEIPGGVEGRTVTFDGQLIPGLERYRIAPAPVPGTAGWVACGYFVLLRPLPAGEHTVRLMLEADGQLVEDLIYRLTIILPS